MKVINPERILRVLERVSNGGLSVQIRSLRQQDVAVKGRAIPSHALQSKIGFSITGLSDKGRGHLLSTAEGGLQIEFVLMSTKIVFYSRLIDMDASGVVVSIPDYLLSIERRKDTRFGVTDGTRAYVRMDDWHVDHRDAAAPPFFEYQRSFASLLQVGDVSVGGLSLVSRFPAACRLLQRGAVIDKSQMMLPLMAPIPLIMEVRWVKRVRENLPDSKGEMRTTRAYKFGIQYVNPTEMLQKELQKFMARLAVAEAI
jgi:hypothetical protein